MRPGSPLKFAVTVTPLSAVLVALSFTFPEIVPGAAVSVPLRSAWVVPATMTMPVWGVIAV